MGARMGMPSVEGKCSVYAALLELYPDYLCKEDE